MNLQADYKAKTYLIDTSVLVEAKNRYYNMQICPGFWVWLENMLGGSVFSIENVMKEVLEGKDELVDWIKPYKEHFLSVDDEPTQISFAEISNYIINMTDFRESAKVAFLSGADPFLIAKAKTLGAVIVTHEKFADYRMRRAIKIPNISHLFNIECIDTFDLLKDKSAQFILKN